MLLSSLPIIPSIDPLLVGERACGTRRVPSAAPPNKRVPLKKPDDDDAASEPDLVQDRKNFYHQISKKREVL